MNKKRNIAFGVGAALLMALLLTTLPALALLGDLDLNDIVDEANLVFLKAAFGSEDGDANWDPRADLNLDDEVDVHDLAIMGRSYHSTFNFYTPRPLANLPGSLTVDDITLDSEDRAHIVWLNSGAGRGVYYTRLDRYGNTMVDDLLLDDNYFVDDARIAMDGQDRAHIIWTTGSNHRLQYAQVDAWGHILVAPMTVVDVGHDVLFQGSTGSGLDRSAHLTARYGDEEVVELGESGLAFYREVSPGQWEAVSTTVDTTHNTARAEITAYGHYALTSRSGYALYLPLILKSRDGLVVKSPYSS